MRSVLSLFALPFLVTIISVSGICSPAEAAEKTPVIAENAMPHKGKVIDVIDAGVYTYIHVSWEDKKTWLAVLTMAVKKDDMIRYGEGPVVSNFFSKTLNRNFDSVIFIGKAAIIK